VRASGTLLRASYLNGTRLAHMESVKTGPLKVQRFRGFAPSLPYPRETAPLTHH
jgi:hypothetical protein